MCFLPISSFPHFPFPISHFLVPTFRVTRLQPTQAQCLGCIRKGATVTTSSMMAVKLLSSYLIGTYDGKTLASFPGRSRLQFCSIKTEGKAWEKESRT